MKALLVKYKDKYNQQIITEVDVMHYSTAVEKLNKAVVLSAKFNKLADKGFLDFEFYEGYAKAKEGYTKIKDSSRIKKQTYSANKHVSETLASFGITDMFEYRSDCDISAVITVTCETSDKVQEYYIVCSDTSHKDEIAERLKNCKEVDRARAEAGYTWPGYLCKY